MSIPDIEPEPMTPAAIGQWLHLHVPRFYRDLDVPYLDLVADDWDYAKTITTRYDLFIEIFDDEDERQDSARGVNRLVDMVHGMMTNRRFQRVLTSYQGADSVGPVQFLMTCFNHRSLRGFDPVWLVDVFFNYKSADIALPKLTRFALTLVERKHRFTAMYLERLRRFAFNQLITRSKRYCTALATDLTVMVSKFLNEMSSSHRYDIFSTLDMSTPGMVSVYTLAPILGFGQKRTILL